MRFGGLMLVRGFSHSLALVILRVFPLSSLIFTLVIALSTWGLLPDASSLSRLGGFPVRTRAKLCHYLLLWCGHSGSAYG